MAVNPLSHKRTLYVGGLDENVSEELIRAAFIPFGDIIQVNIPLDQNTGKHKGFAFLEFEEVDDALAALDNMNYAELHGKVITCSVAKPNVIGGKGKPLWSEEGYIPGEAEQSSESTSTTSSELSSAIGVGVEKRMLEVGNIVKESTVVVNAPKRAKVEGPYTKTLPAGMVRCKECGGWGKDLIQENGLCNHCTRIQKRK